MPLAASPGRQLPPDGQPSKPEDRQRQRLVLALVLFLCAIGVVLYKVTTSAYAPQTIVETAAPAPGTVPTPATPSGETPTTTAPSGASAHPTAPATAPPAAAPVAKLPSEKHKPPVIAEKHAPVEAVIASQAPTITRKILPPLAVEVYAGNRPVPLQTKSPVAIHVDTSSGIQGRAAAPANDSTVAAGDPSNPGRVRISAEALQVLSHPVDPNYPLLAREMKVQGSVILDAYIGRDGNIQALKIVSGPTILATAAMEAVRQWRFKPYLQAGQAVETEARITVNFTISTT